MAHARLSPSASSRWLQCAGSIQLIEESGIEDDSSRSAVEGTYAHSLAELRASLHFNLGDKERLEVDIPKQIEELKTEILSDEFNFNENDIFDMEHYVEHYIKFIEERISQHEYRPSILLEQLLETSVKDCWGTSDVVLMSADHIEIIDLKYGQGLAVFAQDNSQLRIYGIGALEAFGDIVGETKQVSMSVFQPRLDSASTETLDAAELRQWRDEVLRPAAEATELEDPPFHPSPSACQWCPVAGICRANMMDTFGKEFGTVEEPIEPPEAEMLTAEEISKILPRIPGIKKWMAALEKRALDLAYQQGVRIPGYKVIRSSGRRGISDGPSAISALLESGYNIDDVAKMSPETLGKLETLVGGRKKLESIIGDYITMSTGKESLVLETAKGESISPAQDAADDFK